VSWKDWFSDEAARVGALIRDLPVFVLRPRRFLERAADEKVD